VQVPEGRQVLAGMTVQENLEMGGYRRPHREVVRDLALMEERFRSSAPAATLLPARFPGASSRCWRSPAA